MTTHHIFSAAILFGNFFNLRTFCRTFFSFAMLTSASLLLSSDESYSWKVSPSSDKYPSSDISSSEDSSELHCSLDLYHLHLPSGTLEIPKQWNPWTMKQILFEINPAISTNYFAPSSCNAGRERSTGCSCCSSMDLVAEKFDQNTMPGTSPSESPKQVC